MAKAKSSKKSPNMLAISGVLLIAAVILLTVSPDSSQVGLYGLYAAATLACILGSVACFIAWAVSSIKSLFTRKTAPVKRREVDAASIKNASAQNTWDAAVLEDFGLYTPSFDFANSSQYAEALKSVRRKQKDEIRRFNESLKSTTWAVNGKKSEGKRLVTKVGKLVMIAYNGECDDLVRRIKVTNAERSIEAIRKAADNINSLGDVLGISIPKGYVALKVKEAKLAVEFAEAKAAEKEAIREARERQREEQKLAKEIEDARRKLEKERAQYQSAYSDVLARLVDCADDAEREALSAKAEELKGHLADVDKAVQDVDYREANQRAGYVYIISNVGSFGEGVYKIGMTRRLDPMDRINELGDASVPFAFDVHALIFSDDAPGLEAALHRAFEDKKVNLVNQRREFFRVSLDEIKAEVRKNHDETVEFTDEADAEQYRVSEKLRVQ